MIQITLGGNNVTNIEFVAPTTGGGSSSFTGSANQLVLGNGTYSGDFFNRMINTISMGLVEGGLISINADNTKFDVSAGKGVIVDNYTDIDNPVVYIVTWDNFTAVTPTYLSTNTFSHILIARNGGVGEIRQQTNYPTPEEHRDYIYLGQLGHTNLTTIAAVVNKPEAATAPSDQLRDLEDFIGIMNTGNLISANGANLSINKSEGYLFSTGVNFEGGLNDKDPNRKYFPAQVLASIRRRTQTGVGSSAVTTIDPANYDVGGTITALSGTKYTNQRIFLTTAGNLVVQYGQNQYNTMAQAIAGINRESFVVFENLANNAFPVCVLTVRSSATDLSDSAQANFSFPTKLGELNAAAAGISISTLQNAYNNSSEPEVTTDSTRGAFSVKEGTADDTGHVFEGKNNAGDVKFYVRGDGGYQGNNISRVSTVASTATLTPTPNDFDIFEITAQAEPLTIANPIETVSDGNAFVIKVKDDGTARAITFGASYVSFGAPSTTILGKWMYIPVIYNETAVKFDVLGYKVED